jgi:hypothetical protein
MSRAALQYLRQGTGTWKPVGVWQGTKIALAARFLPGVLTTMVQTIIENAKPPIPEGETVRGTWEDWIGYSLDALSNGQDLWIEEVPAANMQPTIDLLYASLVLGLSGDALTSYRPASVASFVSRPVPAIIGPEAKA